MKLTEEMKQKIDAYFESKSAEEEFKIITYQQSNNS